jgi:uracil-DNA glycosylase family 4
MADLVRCVNCPGTIKLVGSKGPIDSPLVIVGESPGWEEVRDGKPFIGPSGKIVDHALKQHPDIPEPFFTNAAICFPGTSSQKNQDRTIAATQCCHDRLMGEISAHPRKVILALGNHALWSLTNDYSHKITQVRGKLYASEHASIGVIAAVHPAFLMRGGGSLRQFMGDFNYALELLKGRDIRKPVIPKYALVESMDQLRWLATEIASKEFVAADSETGGYDGFDHLRDRILCSGYCWDPGIVYVVPEGLTRESNILYENKTRFIWQNGKFDAKFFRAGGVSKVRVDEDTMLLSYALDERGGIHDLEQIASDLISAPNWKFMIQPYLDAERKGKPKGWNQPGFECVPREILYDYMSRDISGTFQCFPILRRQVALQPRLEMLYTKTLMPMSDYLTEVEENGMGVDLTQRDSNSVRLLYLILT